MTIRTLPRTAACPQGDPIPPWESLGEAERARYVDEFHYVHQSAADRCSACSDPVDCVSREMDRYFEDATYHQARKALDWPFRTNTAFMTGVTSALRLAGPAGGFLGLVGGPMLAIGGGFEVYEGVKHSDRRLAVDGAFNVAIGAAWTALPFTPLGAALAGPALVAARELYLAGSR